MTLSEWCDSDFNTTDNGFGNKQYTIGGTMYTFGGVMISDNSHLYDSFQNKVSNDNYDSGTELSDGDEIKMYNICSFNISEGPNYSNITEYTYLDGMTFSDFCNCIIDNTTYVGGFIDSSLFYIITDRFDNNAVQYYNYVIKDITPDTIINNGTTYYTYGQEIHFYIDSTGYIAYEGLSWIEFIDLCQASGIHSELTYDSNYVYYNNTIVNENGSSVNDISVNPYSTIYSYIAYYLRNENE